VLSLLLPPPWHRRWLHLLLSPSSGFLRTPPLLLRMMPTVRHCDRHASCFHLIVPLRLGALCWRVRGEAFCAHNSGGCVIVCSGNSELGTACGKYYRCSVMSVTEPGTLAVGCSRLSVVVL
jgi:hypothetical protein